MKSSPPPIPRPAVRTVPLAAVFAHFLGAIAGLACSIGYDLWFWSKVRGGEVDLDPVGRARAILFVFVLALPVAFVTGGVFGSLEAIVRRRFGRFGVLFSPPDLLRAAPDEVGDATLAIVLGSLCVVSMREVAGLALTRLHAPAIITTVIGFAGPAIVLPFFALFVGLQPVTRRIFAGLERAACPLVFHAVLLQFAYVGRFRIAEAAPALERGLPWYIVWVFVSGAAGHVLASGSLPRTGRGGLRVRRAGIAVLLLVIVAIPAGIVAYGRTSEQRFFVEELSWVGARAHRGWSELLDRDGDGQPSLLGGRDCNDRRADVHPGAIDRPGDHVDSDCFGGDGTPPFDDRGNGNLSLQPIPERPFNVLMISVDTMRPDRLAAAGNRRRVAPHLDALVRESVWFRNAAAPSPRTVRSLPAVFSGQHPGMVRYERSLGRLDVAPENHLLAEMITGRYESFTILGTTYFQETPGLLQGFNLIEQAGTIKPDPTWVTNRAIERLDQSSAVDKPFFGWIHYFNAHEPYLADRFPSRYGSTPADFYDTEIWRADHEIGRIVDHLRERGLLDRTILVVFSDHGEALGEHGAFGHSTRLNAEQIDSVLMIRAPGFAPRIVRTPVALFDLMPTILDLTGTHAWRPMSARSLVPAMRGDLTPYRNRPIFGEVFPDAVYAFDTQSIRVADEKLIFWPLSGRMEYFDLARDPTERHDVRDRHPRQADHLLDTLLAWDAALHYRENRQAQLLADARVRSIPPDATRIDAHFSNGIDLLAAKIHAPRMARDSLLTIDLYFRPRQPITSDYYVHLTFDPTDGVSVGASFVAHHTAVDGSYPTSRWRPGEIIRDTVTIRVPAGIQYNVPLTGHVELWSHFHVPTPVVAQRNGQAVTTVDVGNLLVE